MEEMINLAKSALEETGAFTAVTIADDGSEPMLGREPMAAVAYGGMTASKDGNATVEAHKLLVYVKLLSIGSMDTLPLKTAYAAMELAEASTLSCGVHSTDSRSVTFLITAVMTRSAA